MLMRINYIGKIIRRFRRIIYSNQEIYSRVSITD